MTMADNTPERTRESSPGFTALPATLAEILAANAELAARLAPAALDALAREIEDARRVFVAGAGRSGLIMQLLAVRLGHLGMDVTVVGQTVAPPIGAGDVLVATSGSGETDSTCLRARKAKDAGARVAAFTTRPESQLARLADVVVVVPAASKNTTGQLTATQQYDGSLFEQSTFLIGEAIFHDLARRRHLTAADLWAQHANLE
jgi:6-phospho-3-hexuloisomerase